MKNLILFLLATLFLAPTGFAQFLDLTQPNIAPLRFNPGFTGSLKDTRVTTIFRDQTQGSFGYMGFSGSGKSAYVAYDQVSNRLGGGIGADISFTNVGQRHQGFVGPGRGVNLGVNYAAKVHLGGRWTLSPGIRVHTKLSRYQLLYYVQSRNPTYFSRQEGSLSIMPGIVLNTSNSYFGVSIDNLPRFQLTSADSLYPDVGYKKPVYILQAGYNFSPSPTSLWSIATSVTARRFGSYSLLQPQVIFRYKKLLFGTGLTVFHKGEKQTLRRIEETFTLTQLGFLSLGYKYEKFRVNASLTLIYAAILEVGATFYFSRKLVSESLTIL